MATIIEVPFEEAKERIFAEDVKLTSAHRFVRSSRPKASAPNDTPEAATLEDVPRGDSEHSLAADGLRPEVGDDPTR